MLDLPKTDTLYLQAAAVVKAGLNLTLLLTELKTATAGLNLAKDVVHGPGDTVAKDSIDVYAKSLETARTMAAQTVALANSTLQATITTQNILVQSTQAALDNVQTSGIELHLAALAKQALQDYSTAESKILSELQTAVTGLAHRAEKLSFDAAQQVLAVARRRCCVCGGEVRADGQRHGGRGGRVVGGAYGQHLEFAERDAQW
jgi:hypothetical protein